MTARIEVVPAQVEDIAVIMEMERGMATAPHWSAEVYAGMIADAKDAVKRCVLIARVEGIVAGFGVVGLVDGEAELESVGVRLSRRREGIGEALCTALLAWAWHREAVLVNLEVRASSNQARMLYQKLGFCEVGRRPGYYSSPVEDAVLMQMERTSSAV